MLAVEMDGAAWHGSQCPARAGHPAMHGAAREGEAAGLPPRGGPEGLREKGRTPLDPADGGTWPRCRPETAV